MEAKHLKIEANLNGYADREFLQILALYGFNIDASMLKQNSQSGGHAAIRFLIDLL